LFPDHTHPEILARVFECAPDAEIVLDSERRIIAVNAKTERMFGYRREELVGTRVDTLLPRPGLDGRVVHRKDGTELLVDVTFNPIDPIHTKAGHPKAGALAVAIVREIEQREDEGTFRELLESAPEATVIVDDAGAIVLVNSEAERVFGYERRELLGMPVETLVPMRHRGLHTKYREAYTAMPAQRAQRTDFEFVALRKDGSEFRAEVSLAPLQTRRGVLVSAAVRDVTARARADEEGHRAREAYFKELHHRVQNNLQVISSLLFLQSAFTADAKMLEALRESRDRVRSIALILEKLYGSLELARFDLGEYARDLVADLMRSYGVDRARVSTHVAADPISLELDAAIPCALILNELVSNVFKHAFPAGARGRLDVEARTVAPASVVLTVRDDGVGMPAGHDSRARASFGLRLVADLTRQLDGAIETESGEGTAVRIRFGNMRHEVGG
jgi:PAS domain S-box-containing protein